MLFKEKPILLSRPRDTMILNRLRDLSVYCGKCKKIITRGDYQDHLKLCEYDVCQKDVIGEVLHR